MLHLVQNKILTRKSQLLWALSEVMRKLHWLTFINQAINSSDRVITLYCHYSGYSSYLCVIYDHMSLWEDYGYQLSRTHSKGNCWSVIIILILLAIIYLAQSPWVYRDCSSILGRVPYDYLASKTFTETHAQTYIPTHKNTHICPNYNYHDVYI